MNISKELLSEVLNLNMWKTDSLNISIDENKVYYNGIFLGDLGYQQSSDVVNIYELAHKCKEWALSKNNLELISAITEEGAYCQIDNIVPSTIRYDINQIDTSCRTVFNSIIFDEDTEPEAIFKACDYIINELSNK